MTMIFIVVNLFISLINEYINAVKNNPRAVPRDHKVVTHFINTLKSLFSGIVGDSKKKETAYQKGGQVVVCT